MMLKCFHKSPPESWPGARICETTLPVGDEMAILRLVRDAGSPFFCGLREGTGIKPSLEIRKPPAEFEIDYLSNPSEELLE